MPEENEPIVNPDEMVAQAEEELAGLAPEDDGEEMPAGDGGESVVADEPAAPVEEGPDPATQDFFANLQRLTATQEEDFRMYDPEKEDLVSYTAENAAYAAQKAASNAFKAQQAFNIMIERVPEQFRSEIRAMVASDDSAMSHPRSVAQAVAAAIGLKVLSGTTSTKKSSVVNTPKAARQVGAAAQPASGSNDREYQAFLKAFGTTAKEYPYSRYKAEGVR